MTTAVRILIEGNKTCEVSVAVSPAVDSSPVTVKPGAFVIRYISGDQVLSVREVGEFVT